MRRRGLPRSVASLTAFLLAFGAAPAWAGAAAPAAAGAAAGVAAGATFPPPPTQTQASAQDQAPRLRTDVDTTVVTVGDPITLQISVDHAPDARVAWPDSLDLAPFEVLGARASGPSTQGGVAQSSLTVALAAYELGDLEIPGFQVAVVGAQGDTTFLDTNPFGIHVESVGLDEGGDIRALKGPLGLPLNRARVALWVLALALMGAMAFALYRRFRRGREEPGQAMGPAVPARPPHEVALEALARLEASPLLERGDVKEYHIQLSDILRTYVEGRFRVPALEMTTRDIVAGLERAGVEPSVRQGFNRFLDRCDMVKFAKNRPNAETSRQTLALGRSLVEETIAEPQPAETGDTPGTTATAQTAEPTVSGAAAPPEAGVPVTEPEAGAAQEDAP